MIQYLLPILVFVGVAAVGGAIVLSQAHRRSLLKPRLADDGELPAAEPAGSSRLVRGMTAIGRAISLGRVSTSLKEQLARAGYHRDSAAMTFLGVKLLLLVLGVAGSTAAVMPLGLHTWIKAYLIVMVSCILFFAPNFAVRIRRQRRANEIRNTLPTAIDLLEVCVSAGMGLDTAWNAVSDEIRHVSPTLADEMTLVNLEMQLGSARTDAMRHMAERTGAEELTALVALLVQSDRFGTSVAEALRTFATSMREQRSLVAEERAEKMAVKLLLPLVFFIFPVMMIVIAGPAAITIFDMVSK